MKTLNKISNYIDDLIEKICAAYNESTSFEDFFQKLHAKFTTKTLLEKMKDSAKDIYNRIEKAFSDNEVKVEDIKSDKGLLEKIKSFCSNLG